MFVSYSTFLDSTSRRKQLWKAVLCLIQGVLFRKKPVKVECCFCEMESHGLGQLLTSSVQKYDTTSLCKQVLNKKQFVRLWFALDQGV